MPDLGRYAAEVLSAYAGTFVLLAALILASVWKSKRVLKQMREAEKRREKTA